MMQEGLKHFTEIPWIVFGMLLFFTTYMGVLGFTLWGSKAKERMEKFGKLPLEEDGQV